MTATTTRAIRPLAAGDHAQWLPLWHGYEAFYKRPDVPAEITRTAWTRLLDPAEPMFGALCWDGAEAAGLVHWLVHRSFRTVENHVYLADLFAAPARRGQGIGRLLIEHVYGAAEAAGCSRVWWLTHETNRTAMLLYDRIAEKSGFVHYRKQLG